MTARVRHQLAAMRVRVLIESERDRAIRRAKEDGHRDGMCGRQTTNKNYRTGEEWVAWLEGWRDGQGERKSRGWDGEFARLQALITSPPATRHHERKD